MTGEPVCVIYCLLSTALWDGYTLVIATLQMGKLRHKEVQQKTQDHAAGGRAGTGTQLCKTLRPLVFTWHPCNGNI